jgi:hypothetical protein
MPKINNIVLVHGGFVNGALAPETPASTFIICCWLER